MKNITAAALVSSMALFAGVAQAGGPVVVEDMTEVVPEKAGSSVGILPIIIIGVALCAALCGSDDDYKKKY